jgi:hypothetical protein
VKITKTFDASIVLNPEKGGGWLAKWHIHDGEKVVVTTHSAWKNASAAKRWLKAEVQANTPRKSVKMEPIKLNELQKPIHFAGSLTFKGDK